MIQAEEESWRRNDNAYAALNGVEAESVRGTTTTTLSTTPPSNTTTTTTTTTTSEEPPADSWEDAWQSGDNVITPPATTTTTDTTVPTSHQAFCFPFGIRYTVELYYVQVFIVFYYLLNLFMYAYL